MFKDLFTQLLQKNNITAYKLSKDTGITEGLISQWKSGRQLPKYDNIKILCDYFNVSADYLLERTDNPEINRTALIEEITKLIQNKGMTEKQFLKEAGLTASALSEWRKGKAKPSLDAIFKIAEYFNVSVDYLLDRTDNPEINRTAPIEEIANLIKDLCDKHNISINKMLIESGAGARTYHNMMAGSFPSADKFAKIAEFFNCSVDYLLGRTDNPEINRTGPEEKEIKLAAESISSEPIKVNKPKLS